MTNRRKFILLAAASANASNYFDKSVTILDQTITSDSDLANNGYTRTIPLNYSANGVELTGDGTALGDYFEYNERSSLDRQETFANIRIDDVTSKFAVFKRGSYLRGTMVVFDCENSLIRFKQPWGGSATIPSDKYTAPLTIPIVLGETYNCVLRRDRGISYASIERVSTGEKNVIQNEFGVGTYYFSGSFWGKAGVGAISGSITVPSFKYSGLFPNTPSIGIYGDSWVEAYTLQQTTNGLNDVWNRKLWSDKKGDLLISGRGGDTSADLLARLTMDFDPFLPKKCIILIGLNDSGYTTWRSNVDAIAAHITGLGSEVVLTTLPPRSGKESFINAANAWMLSQTDYTVIDIAESATLNGDRVTQNPIYYDTEGAFTRDDVHYNMTYSEVLYNLIKPYT